MDRPRAIRVSTPTRACLSGEDLDWLGGRSVCVALDLLTTAEVNDNPTEGQDPAITKMAEEIWRFMRERIPGLTQRHPAVQVHSAAPQASGLSSSTALISTLLRAFVIASGITPAVPQELIVQWGYEFEFAFCNGGGMDQEAIARGGVTFFEGCHTGLPRLIGNIDFPAAWSLMVIDSRTSKSTPHHIRSVRAQQVAADPVLVEYVRRCTASSDQAWHAIESCDLAALTDAMAQAHRAMRDLQKMSTPLLERLRSTAWNEVGLGLKLSGAGRGGALVGVCPVTDAATIAVELATAYERSPLDAQVLVVGPIGKYS